MKKVTKAFSLPSELDEALRVLAFHRGVSYQDQVIEFLRHGMMMNSDVLHEKAPGLLRQMPMRDNSSRQAYRYFLNPWSKKYVEFDISSDITVWNVYHEDGRHCLLQGQDGSTELKLHEQMEVGRIIELHKQVMNKKLDYDPHILWTDEYKKWYLP